MEILTIKKGKVKFRKNDYDLIGHEVIDDQSVHLSLGNSVICFVVSETKLNGVVHETVEDFINALN